MSSQSTESPLPSGPAKARRRRPTRKLLFGLVTVLGLFGLLELTLSLAGFNYARTPQMMKTEFVRGYVSWQNANVPTQHFELHPRRMWTAQPNRGEANAAGFLGPLLTQERDPTRVRVLFLGDSCTTGSESGYARQTIALLAKAGVAAEPLIAGVGGYSTHQGLDYMREALAWNPDVVVAYFGWNDHWLSPEPDHAFEPPARWQRTLTSMFGPLRTYQLLHRVIHPPYRPAEPPRTVEAVLRAVRVPPDRFAANVEAMIRLASERGLPLVFVAAPYAPQVTETPRPELMSDPALIPEVHTRYCDALRKTADGNPGVTVLSFSPFDETTMLRDGIHPTPKGYAKIAAKLSQALIETGVRAPR